MQFLILGLAASITACGSSNNTETGEDPAPLTEETVDTEAPETEAAPETLESGQDITEDLEETEAAPETEEVPETEASTETLESGQDIPEDVEETEEKAN